MATKKMNELFNNKLFRIPDYQRGYAWQSKQVEDFWEDLINLDETRSHYAGLLTLETIQPNSRIGEQWTEDAWIIEDLGYIPYYVVDGQQRITTSIILIQVLLDEVLRSPDVYQNQISNISVHDIRKKYIRCNSPNEINRSYILRHVHDHPTYKYFRANILGDDTIEVDIGDNLYTENLRKAKFFFENNLRALIEIMGVNNRQETVNSIYRKLTNKFLYNEHYIEDKFDVFISFESMNNRGKKLSDLELLKNRLIYLSTLFTDEENARTALRQDINNAWRACYSHLGRNKDRPLADDDFLKAHWTMYFKYGRSKSKEYINDLLKNQFSADRVIASFKKAQAVDTTEELHDDIGDEELDTVREMVNNGNNRQANLLTMIDISRYCLSLSRASEKWYYIYNPNDMVNQNEESKWLDKLIRIRSGHFRSLIMCSLMKGNITNEQRVKLFQAIERYIFIVFRMSQQRSDYGSSEFYNISRMLYYDKKNIEEVITLLSEKTQIVLNDDNTLRRNKFYDLIHDEFTMGNKQGFYKWKAIRYFLFEYECYCQERAGINVQKIHWDEFTRSQRNQVTIEHILPQNSERDCWREIFSNYSDEELNAFTNSLGNLLALSRSKNAALQNYCYEDKRSDGNADFGYFNGSYSEIKVAEIYQQWNPEAIRDRGLELLAFLEKRWDISLGDMNDKIKLLHLEFMNDVDDVE